MAAKVNSVSARRALAALGTNIKTARLKRRISMKDFAQRISVSESTVARLEKGDDGVSIGTLAMACLVLGEVDQVARFLDPASDDTGLLLDREALPKRIGRKRKMRSKTGDDSQRTVSAESDDEDGVGF